MNWYELYAIGASFTLGFHSAAFTLPENEFQIELKETLIFISTTTIIWPLYWLAIIVGVIIRKSKES